MTRPFHRPASLPGLLARYLLLTAALGILAAVLWWLGVSIFINSGLVLPAYSGERAALAALHDPALALNGCDRLLVLADGGVRAVLDPARDALPVLQAQLAALYGRISLHRLRGADGCEQLVMLKEEDPA